MNSLNEPLKSRLFNLKERIKIAANKSGRTESDVTLVAVTKTVPPNRITDAIGLGIQDIGENRIQEWAQKAPEFQSSQGVRFHMIGHLHTNKAKKAGDLCHLIQTGDRPDLAQILDRLCSEKGQKRSCLIEVKISAEATKTGIPYNEAESFIQGFERYPHLELKGLMTIPPLGISLEETRQYFRQFKVFFERHVAQFGERPILSMGMTDDFELAIEEGSTMVRIGRGLFGDRN